MEFKIHLAVSCDDYWAAWVYFNQEEVGRALAASFKENHITRENVFITTKVNTLTKTPQALLHRSLVQQFHIHIVLKVCVTRSFYVKYCNIVKSAHNYLYDTSSA